MRSVLLNPGKIRLSKLIYTLGNRPRFVDSVHPPIQKGIVCLSADFELAWAWRYSKRKVDPLAIARHEREYFQIILNFLNDMGIPITWATVGHLFLDSCSRKNGKPHIDLLRPNYFENEFWKYDKGDWFDIDPCGNYKTHPEFYAPDLIERILQSRVPHELGCHSFSHIDYSEKNSTADLIDNDLHACEAAAAAFGITLKSFVFPWNIQGHFDLVRNYGYNVVRYKTNDLKEIGYPETLENGLVAIHDSMAFDQSEEGWGNDYLVRKMKKYVDRVIEKKAICHFWFHPSISKSELEEIFVPVLRYISSKREQGLLEIKTMKEIGALSTMADQK